MISESQNPKSQAPAGHVGKQLAMSRMRVLLVDDEPGLLETLAQILCDEGYVVVSALEGEDAVDIADVFPPDIVVTDLRLPGLDGISTVEQIRSHLPSLDVVDDAADLDGRRGVALGISEDGERQEIILDPGTGEVIGERKVSDSMFAGIPRGTVTSYSSVTTAVVDQIGANPAR